VEKPSTKDSSRILIWWFFAWFLFSEVQWVYGNGKPAPEELGEVIIGKNQVLLKNRRQKKWSVK
jgi:hypothetical protein